MTSSKLDIHELDKRLGRLVDQTNSSNMSQEQKKRIERFILEARMGKNSKKRVGNARLCANLSSFLRLNEYFKKDFNKLTEQEVEKFQRDLDRDKIKRKNGNLYKSSTKDELIRGLKRYTKWSMSEEDYKKKVMWIKQYEEVAEVPAINKKDAEKLANAATNLRDKALIIFLFDSGCRIEEALNLKIKQIEKRTKENKDDFYIVDIKVSKTLPRKISVPIATPFLTKWLAEHPAITDKEAYLFPVKYDAVRMMLSRLSKESICVHVTPHILRHSSASFYCKKINNPYKFCYRYGWTIGSNMAKRYIDRNLLGEEAQEELDNLIQGDRTKELENQMEKLRKEMNDLRNLIKFRPSDKELVDKELIEELKEKVMNMSEKEYEKEIIKSLMALKSQADS